MAQQYRGRIGHWVIWNEPDVWQEGHPGRTWEGSEADYATLLKTAYLAIKDVDPSMEVHLAGLTYYWDWEHGRRRYLDRLLEIIAADPEAAAHDFYFDAVVYHLYFNPSQTADVIRETRQTLNRYGMAGKAIWINETNAPPSEDPEEPPWSAPRFRVSLEEQAAFVLQQFAVAFAAGAGRVEFYKLQNSAGHPESIEPFGLLRADGTRRPAFTAFQVATTYLGNFRTARREDQGDVTAVTFDRGDGTTTVLWTGSRGDRQARVNAISPSALLVDERGNTTELAAVDGAYTVALPGAICTQQTSCFIGGAPRLLVEAGSPAGRPALAEPPPATPASNPTPAPSPSSTATPTTKATPPPAPTATPTRTLAPTATPAQSPTAPRATRPPAPTPTAAVIPATPSPSPTGAAIPEPAGQEPGTSPDRSGILAIAGMAAVAIAGGLGLIRRRR
jgi:hypothetical protein